jgi:hypothetical protein
MDQNYIFNSWDELTQSELFLGHVAYPTRRLQNWYTWLYLAEIKTNKQIKIGITNSLARRKHELEQREPPAVIKFAWSMPCPAIVERAVKQMLGAFIVKRKQATKTEAGYTEVLQGLPMIPLLLSVRLIILFVYLCYDFIPPGLANSSKKEIIRQYMGDASSMGGGSLNANVIQYGGVYYEGTVNNLEWRATLSVLNDTLQNDPELLPALKSGTIPRTVTLMKMKAAIMTMDDDDRTGVERRIHELMTALETEVVRNRYVCVIEDVYSELQLAIEGPPQHTTTTQVPTKTDIYNQSFFKLYVASLTDESNDHMSQENEPSIIMVDHGSFNDEKPAETRIKDVKKGSKLYLALEVEYDQKFIRFFNIIVTTVSKRTERGSGHTTTYVWYKWATADWMPWGKPMASFPLDPELERTDFRDRPAENTSGDGQQTVKPYWGVYQPNDPTPQSGRALGPFNITYGT